MKIIGLDPSLTSTGFAVAAEGELVAIGSILSSAPPTNRDSAEVRIDRISTLNGTWFDVLDSVTTHHAGPLLVVCESRDYQTRTKQGGHATDRAGLMVQYLITARSFGALLVYVAPPALKLYAAGDGGADKDAVRAAVEQRYDRRVANTDESDALTLAAMGADVYGFPLADAPEANRQALRSPDWPIIGVTRGGVTDHIVPRIPTTTTKRKRTRS